MRRALDMFVVEGIYTTIPLHQRIMTDPDFIAGNFNTSFLATHGAKKPVTEPRASSTPEDDPK
jgi:biotin carboxylase